MWCLKFEKGGVRGGQIILKSLTRPCDCNEMFLRKYVKEKRAGNETGKSLRDDFMLSGEGAGGTEVEGGTNESCYIGRRKRYRGAF